MKTASNALKFAASSGECGLTALDGKFISHDCKNEPGD
jgi:hypothetical protein